MKKNKTKKSDFFLSLLCQQAKHLSILHVPSTERRGKKLVISQSNLSPLCCCIIDPANTVAPDHAILLFGSSSNHKPKLSRNNIEDSFVFIFCYGRVVSLLHYCVNVLNVFMATRNKAFKSSLKINPNSWKYIYLH